MLRAQDLQDADKVALFDTQENVYKNLQYALIAQNQPEKTLQQLDRVDERVASPKFCITSPRPRDIGK